MKWAIQAKEEEKNKHQTFSADGWTGNQRSSQMWWRNEQELLYPEPRTEKTSELNGSGGGRGKGIRGARPFVPVGGTNRDKRGDFCPGWWFQPGQKATRAFCPGWIHQPGQNAPILSRLVSPTGTKGLGPLIPFPLPPPEPFSSLVSCCSRLGREEFLLISSPHLWRSLIPRPSIGTKGLELVFLFFLGLYSSFHALEIEKMCS